MADNYLERKMEEHRAGRDIRPTVRRQPHASPLPAAMPRRIAIIAHNRRHITQFVTPLQHPQCHIAIINTLPAHDTDLPDNHGTRYYHITDTDRLTQTLNILSRAWLDIDIVILTDPDTETIAAIACHLPTRIPATNIPLAAIIVGNNILHRTIISADTTNTHTQTTPPPDTPDQPTAPHIPYLTLRTSANITTIKL